ncbi:DUF222 domain-containing protein [Myceligenerans sp. TRM 65318]|uniref:DUF222 domain-containing protein n=1 Tax=Myceligenerans pegani TaxID=2776917 RepID=A0ABR9MVW6_9MICO|nr:HNH endonuclease signature motif containing protein [Myceligenerans sp. TRM 65318]MBE1875532.1 DUF222 domain-containing protein [Myceligenerans sp. TRM 65318]
MGGGRPVGALLDDLESLTAELIATAGPRALEADPAGAGSDGATVLAGASARLRMVGHRLEVLRTTFLPLIDEAGLWALTGARTFAIWLAATEQIRNATARREVRTATVLRDVLPAACEAALDGRIGPDHLRAMVDVAPTSQARRDALAAPAVDEPLDDGRDSTPDERGAPDEVHDGNRRAGSADTTRSTSDPAGADDAATTDDAGTNGAAATDRAGSDADGPGQAANADGMSHRHPVEHTGPDGDGRADGAGGPDGDGDAVGRSRIPTWEEQLLEWADERQAEDFRGLVRYFARQADPEADERGLKKARDKEYLSVSPTMDGFHVAGFLTPEHGELVTTALGSVMGAPAAEDDRTPGQRRAQGLADLARIALDNGHTGSGAAVRPHLNVAVSWTELQRLTHHTDRTPGSADEVLLGAQEQTAPPETYPAGPAPAVVAGTDTPVPTSLLRRITCDCEVTRIVFGPDGAVLDVGRAQRTVTGPMRRAVIARDKHCVWPGCDQPPARCEVHHAVRHWADGGRTSADNAALLCWHHHDRVDGQHIAMRWTGNASGTRHSGWSLTDRNGREISLAGVWRDPPGETRHEATTKRPAELRRPDVRGTATVSFRRGMGDPGELAA